MVTKYKRIINSIVEEPKVSLKNNIVNMEEIKRKNEIIENNKLSLTVLNKNPYLF